MPRARAPTILETKSPCPPPRNGISGPTLSPGTPFDSTTSLIKMPSGASPLSLSPTAGERVLLTTDSLVLSNDDDGAPERMVVALTTVRIEVTDTRTEGVPVVPVAAMPTDVRDTGRGLLLVEHLADRWDWHPRRDGPGKTVWAEYVLPAGG